MTTVTDVAPATPGTDPERAVPRGPAIWFSLITVALAGLVPAYLIASTPLSMASSDAWIWGFWVVVLAGTRFAWLIAQGSTRLFEMVFWVFSYMFVGLAPMSQFRSGSYAATTPGMDPSLNGMAMRVVWVGLVAFVIGVAIATMVPGRRDERFRVPLVVPHKLYIGLTLITLWCGYYVAKIGPSTLAATRETRGIAEAAAWGNPTLTAIVVALADLAPVIGFAAVMRLRRQRKAAGLPAPVWWAVIMALLAVMLDNPVSTARYVSGTAVLSVIVALGVTLHPRGFRLLSVGLVAGLVFVFPIADMFRYNSQAPGDTTPTSFAETFQTPDFDAIDQINNTLAYVRDNGTTNGKQITGVLFFFVPRTVWASKADDTGSTIADYRGYTVRNLSAPIWTELFIDGGWIWLATGMGLLGFAFRRLDSQAIDRMKVFAAPGLLAGTLPFYFIIMLRGSLLQAMAGFTVLSLVALAVGRHAPASRFPDELTGR